MTTTNPSQKDHLQHAVDVLEAENAELRQMATVLMLQIQGLRGGQQSNGPPVTQRSPLVRFVDSGYPPSRPGLKTGL
jgi:hypothetical protein